MASAHPRHRLFFPAEDADPCPHVIRREAAVRKLYRWLAVSLLAFFCLYLVSGLYGPATARPLPGLQEAAKRSLTAADRSGNDNKSLGRSLLLAARRGDTGGDPELSTAQRGVRAALFLSVSLINLLAVSTMWARAADVFSSDAGGQLPRPRHCITHTMALGSLTCHHQVKPCSRGESIANKAAFEAQCPCSARCAGVRLFGFLGAGATLGQLTGSLAATAAGRLASWRSASTGGIDAAATGLQLSLLLGAAALMECAGRLVGGVRRSPGKVLRGGAQPFGSRDGLEDGAPASKVSTHRADVQT